MLCDPAAAYRGRPRRRIRLADTGTCTKKTPDPCKAVINIGYVSRRGPEQRPHPTPPGQKDDSARCSAPAGTRRLICPVLIREVKLRRWRSGSGRTTEALRRELLDRMLILSEANLCSVLDPVLGALQHRPTA